MSTHLSKEQLTAYVHQTLTDARREEMDQHLADCTRCRVRLADYESLQRHIRYSLLADLRAVRSSPRMNFCAISPRLQRPGTFGRLWRQSSRLFSGAAALATLALQAAILLALLGSMSQPVAGSTLALSGIHSQPPSSAGSGQPPGVGELAPGWFVAAGGLERSAGLPQSAHACDYEAGVDRTVAHSGRASGVVKSKVSAPTGVGTLMQAFRADGADDYRGQKIRVSGYVKAEGVEGWAALWVRVDGKYQVSYLDRMQDGLVFSVVEGSTNWERREIVLDVPEDGKSIAFGISLEGTGQVWLDDVQFKLVDN